MSQTRTQSAIEAGVNILVGYTVNICANFAIFPLFGWEITLEQNLTIGVFYTVVSFLRSFGLRRFYNWWHGRPRKPKQENAIILENSGRSFRSKSGGASGLYTPDLDEWARILGQPVRGGVETEYQYMSRLVRVFGDIPSRAITRTRPSGQTPRQQRLVDVVIKQRGSK